MDWMCCLQRKFIPGKQTGLRQDEKDFAGAEKKELATGSTPSIYTMANVEDPRVDIATEE